VIKEAGLKSMTAAGPAWFSKLAEPLLDLLFPPTCIVCHSLGGWLCSHCLDQIEPISPPICSRCGLPQTSAAAADHSSPTGDALTICTRCIKRPPPLDGLRAYAYHSGPLKQAIHQLKYGDLRALAAPLGELMSRAWIKDPSFSPKIDTIVPVPLHPTRQRERGYNQAALLARELGIRLRLPVVEGALNRTRATVPQVGLDARQREDNVRGAFLCIADSLSGKAVLLVDDVCTTGSTLEAACAALKDSGVPSVWAYTLARAEPHARDA
jgi:ComF family protein